MTAEEAPERDVPAVASSFLPAGFAPLRVRIFRILWFASIVSNIGSWMQTVGAQWLLVEGNSSALLVSLVQTAAAAPVLLFAVPAGVIGEFLNRRRVLLYSQLVQLLVVLALTYATWTGQSSPALLLTATFLLGVMSAVQLPAFQALVPDIVPRAMLVDAASLSAVEVNVARAVGPAIAGLVVAQFGVAAVFLLNAVSFVLFLAVLVGWRTYRPPTPRAEPFVDAARAGTRYILHSRVVRGLLLRLGLFLLTANALWALLPSLASSTLGLSADGYGLMLAALGAGSILGAFLLPLTRRTLSTSTVVLLSSIVFGSGMVVVTISRTLWLTFPALVATGLAWIGVIATINGAVQAFLPAWVRTRGLSYYQLAFFGCTAVGSAAAGALSNVWGLEIVVLGAGVVTVVGGLTMVVWRLPDTRAMGREIVPEPGTRDDVIAPRNEDAAVVALIRYAIPPDDRPTFFEVMREVEQSRLRTGARQWGVFDDMDDPDAIIEAYAVGSWREHLSQLESRTTQFDAELIESARAMSTVPPLVTHLLHTGPSSVPHHRPRPHRRAED